MRSHAITKSALAVAALLLLNSCTSTNHAVSPNLSPAPPQHLVILAHPVGDNEMIPQMYWESVEPNVDFYRVYRAAEGAPFEIMQDSIHSQVSGVFRPSQAALRATHGGDPGIGSDPQDPTVVYYTSGWNRYYITAFANGVESEPSNIVSFHSDSMFSYVALMRLGPDSRRAVTGPSVTFSWKASPKSPRYFIELWRDGGVWWEPVWFYATSSSHADLFETIGATYFRQEAPKLSPGAYVWLLWAVDDSGFGSVNAWSSFQVVR